MNARKRAIATLTALLCLIGLTFTALRFTKAPALHYDNAYWPEESTQDERWIWAKTSAGITYSLYLPEHLRGDAVELEKKALVPESIPMIVCFHGSTGKHTAKDRFGRIFTTDTVQNRFGPQGIAVLVPQSRVEYFSDPHAYSRLIQNICIQHRVIDPSRIAGYGFSQGAAFVHEMTGYDPFIFRAGMTGSSYYSSSIRELFNSARVHYYCALSRNDAGIYEQGLRTAKILSVLAPHSRYREYEKRGHFFVEMHDTTGRGDETALDWLVNALE